MPEYYLSYENVAAKRAMLRVGKKNAPSPRRPTSFRLFDPNTLQGYDVKGQQLPDDVRLLQSLAAEG